MIRPMDLRKERSSRVAALYRQEPVDRFYETVDRFVQQTTGKDEM